PPRARAGGGRGGAQRALRASPLGDAAHQSLREDGRAPLLPHALFPGRGRRRARARRGTTRLPRAALLGARRGLPLPRRLEGGGREERLPRCPAGGAAAPMVLAYGGRPRRLLGRLRADGLPWWALVVSRPRP